MRKISVIIVALACMVLLGSCASNQEETDLFEGMSSSEIAQLFINDAECVYFQNGEYEFKGAPVYVLVPAFDGPTGYLGKGYLEAMLETLRGVDLSQYEECGEHASTLGFTQEFYTGIDENYCKVTFGVVDMDTKDILMTLSFGDGEELSLTGPYSNLTDIPGMRQSILSNTEEIDGNIRVTRSDGSEPEIRQRGAGAFIISVFETVVAAGETRESLPDSEFEAEVNVIGGDTYFFDQETMSFQTEVNGKEQVYQIPDTGEVWDACLFCLGLS